MATTFGAAAPRNQPAKSRGRELIGLLLASSIIVCGLWLVYRAKTENPDKVSFAEIQQKLANQEILNLNRARSPEEIAPRLTALENDADRAFAAQHIFASILQQKRQLANVGELARIRVGRSEIAGATQLPGYKQRLKAIQEEEALTPPAQPDKPVTLLTQSQLAQLKPSFIVRSPGDFTKSFAQWSALALLVFFAVHLFWRWRGWTGDQLLLPLALLLSGVGLILMASLRDPLRDTFSLGEFAFGLVVGVGLLGAVSQFDCQRLLAGFTLTPLLLALGLSALLLIFGTGPGTSDAKVNLFGTQPVEFIKILVALFLAGYFANNWDILRELKQPGHWLTDALRLDKLPRLRLFLPVLLGTGAVLLFFFLQKDLGPALVLGCTFLALYAVARQRAGLVALGLGLLVGGVTIGYRFGWPATVAQRIRIWLDPLENGLRNGDQIAHGWWALSTGGMTGAGLGLGDPSLIPAGHTDLILASLGEELGFVGVALALGLYFILLARMIHIARRAPDYYSFFLTLGLALLTAWQMALITGGILGLVPLSGVVSPFLSWGKSSMLANCLILGLALAVSAQRGSGEATQPFRVPLKRLAIVLGAVACVLTLRAAQIQIWQGDANIVAPVLTKQADGEYRYLYNPRVLAAERRLPQGAIYDRNGLPLATSSWEELERHHNEYAALGINLEAVCRKSDRRHYPLGGPLFHLLGDARTRDNFAAPNTAYVEDEYSGRLSGFDDHRALVVKTVLDYDPDSKTTVTKDVRVVRRDLSALIPLVRYRYRPDQSEAAALLNKKRAVTMSVDARLQLRVSAILAQKLKELGQDKAAIAVLDPANGDLLASVSYPWPAGATRPPAPNTAEPDDDQRITERLDRARFGTYPPGSTFKLVTAMAALRKDAALAEKKFECVALGDGRVGNTIKGYGTRPVRDDIGDRFPHGQITMSPGLVVSCNAYFAQLGANEVGAMQLFQTAQLFDLAFTQDKNFALANLTKSLPQASYGQSPILATPLQMARVAATVAGNGQAPFVRWVTDESNQRNQPPTPIVPFAQAAFLASAMRQVVTNGTGRKLAQAVVPVAGKTGTAEIEGKPSHSWFIGFAPYQGQHQIAFAVVVENGGYGGGAAANLSSEVVRLAHDFSLVR